MAPLSLHHGPGPVERGALLVGGLVLAAFIGLAAASTIYDVGGWLEIW
jgi:hypothetical protein